MSLDDAMRLNVSEISEDLEQDFGLIFGVCEFFISRASWGFHSKASTYGEDMEESWGNMDLLHTRHYELMRRFIEWEEGDPEIVRVWGERGVGYALLTETTDGVKGVMVNNLPTSLCVVLAVVFLFAGYFDVALLDYEEVDLIDDTTEYLLMFEANSGLMEEIQKLLPLESRVVSSDMNEYFFPTNPDFANCGIRVIQ